MNNPGLTGLQSLQQHGVAIPGETKNMEYFFNLAKKMSDGQLADVLAGKSLNVPQFVAMTEAMGRKQLRQAVAGAQAQQQAQQPSIKDQLLAETAAGIDQLPAPNMESMGEGYAAGGIIAFGGGGDVPRYQGEFGSLVGADGRPISSADLLPETLEEELKRKPLSKEAQAALDKARANVSSTESWKTPKVTPAATVAAEEAPGLFRRGLGLLGKGARFLGPIGVAYESMTSEPLNVGEKDMLAKKDFFEQNKDAFSKLSKDDQETAKKMIFEPRVSFNRWKDKFYTPIEAANTKNSLDRTDRELAGSPSSGLGAIKSYEDFLKGINAEDRLAKYEGLGDKLRTTNASQKGIAQGELLMGLAKPFFTKARLNEAVGEASDIAAKGSAAMRAEQAKAEEKAMEYDFAVAKAREAADKNDVQNYLHYMQIAEQAKYHSAALAKQGQVTRGAALKEYNDFLQDATGQSQKRLAQMGITSFDQYYRYVNGLSHLQTVDKLPGKGATVRS